MTGDCCIFKFLPLSVDEKDSMRFQSETSSFKFVGRHLKPRERAIKITVSVLPCLLSDEAFQPPVP